MFNEMKLAALLHKPGAGPKAMRAQEVLDMATRDGAKALSWFDQIGSIEVGKKADLIAMDLTTPLNTVWKHAELDPEAIASSVVYSSSPAQLRWTMVDGRVLWENGKCATISERTLTAKLQKAQDIIRRKSDQKTHA
jgi:cytosine/adenosine deaminase-related metal-dependent hydrolase